MLKAASCSLHHANMWCYDAYNLPNHGFIDPDQAINDKVCHEDIWGMLNGADENSFTDSHLPQLNKLFWNHEDEISAGSPRNSLQ